MNKISIIIPLFKSEFFLNKLNYSLVHQTYSNLEIIYVNDGSPDNSLKLVQEFQLHDSRIKIIDKSNEGQAAALNDGIAISTGDFIMFIDADDWIELNTCELAIDAATRYDVDMVFWPHFKEYANKSVPGPFFFPESKLFTGKDMQFLRRRMMGLVDEELKKPMSTDYFSAGWGKLYKADIIKSNRIFWTDTMAVGSSDVLFNAQLNPHIKSAYYLNLHLHHYNKYNPNSLTKTYNNTLKIKLENLFVELNKVIQKNYINEEKDEFEKALNNRIALSTVNISLGYVSKGISSTGYRLFKNLITSEPFSKSYKKLQIKYMPFHYRMFFFMCKNKISIPAYLMIYFMSKFRKK
jgi:glycosyltransferase EpsH